MIPNIDILFRLLLAALLGGIVGVEREIHGRPAGVRTYLILCLSSAMLMVLSEYLLVYYPGRITGLTAQGDPARIAAQAITGIGFLGAGVIIRYRDSIRGLTTAACVWLVCSVGLAVGAGFYMLGVAVTGVTVVALIGLKAWERMLKKDWFEKLEVVSVDYPGQLDRLKEVIAKHGFKVVTVGVRKDAENHLLTASFNLMIRAVRPERQIIQDIIEVEGVKAVELG